MDMYKKKSLKFCNNQVSRDSRHAQTLKARESSRFKRLSMLRSLNEESIKEDSKSVESVKMNCEEKKKPLSRLEMLFKWKQEKQIKKELEKNNNKKPFYVGCQSWKNSSDKNLQSRKLTPAHPSTNFNTSKTTKSRLVTPGTSFQSSKFPNNSKLNGIKSASAVRSVSSQKLTKTLGKPVVSKINQMSSIPKTSKCYNRDPVTKNNPDTGSRSNGNFFKSKSEESSVPKPAFSKQSSKPITKESSVPKPAFSKQSSKPTTKESSFPKPAFSKQSSKPATKIGIPTLSNTLSKGISVQRAQSQSLQKPVSSINRKAPSASVSKIRTKAPLSSMENATTRNKGYGFKQTNEPGGDGKDMASNLDLLKGTEYEIKLKKDINENNSENLELGSHSEQSLENNYNRIFDCDVSIIKCAPSFAPVDFKFIPPDGLPNFTFDEEAFERIKLKFLSRTSTPSKPDGRSPSLGGKNLKETSCDESPIADKINLLQKAVSKTPGLLKKGTPDQIVCKETEVVKQTEKDYEDILKNSAYEELQNESDANLVNNMAEDKDKDVLKERDNELAINKIPKICEDEDVCIDSPLDTVDLSKIKDVISKQMQLMELEDEELNDVDKLPEEQDKYNEKKSLNIHPKRASMLKNMLVLNSIAETSETDECIQSPSISKNNKNSAVTPRRSQRLSKLVTVEESSTSAITVTPRRSLRLQNVAKKCQFGDEEVFSSFEENKLKSKHTPRRSIRLIDLNTPGKDINDAGSSKTNITVDFEKLTLKELENVNPNDFLFDFESSPDCVAKLKPKKISLLYSPEKIRKSIRKSIRGDLMSFSPCD